MSRKLFGFVLLLMGLSNAAQANGVLPAGMYARTEMPQGQPARPGNAVLVKAQNIYYENTIKNIIQTDCGRCHSVPNRYLMDYDNLKMYADSGLLATMVQGPMRRFAGNDVQTILTWIQNGAPEKPAVTPAGFFSGPPCATPGRAGVPGGQITYQNTIQPILAKDCLRCHSGPFRNLTTYKNVKMYADNGLLKTLVMPGGPMHRFAGPETRFIIAWVDNGAPQ